MAIEPWNEKVAVIEPRADGNATGECYRCDWVTYAPLHLVAHNILVHIKAEHGLVKYEG